MITVPILRAGLFFISVTGSVISDTSSFAILNLPSSLATGESTFLTASLSASISSDEVVVLWQAEDQDSDLGQTFELSPSTAGTKWVECEIQHIDGRRFYLSSSYVANESVTNSPYDYTTNLDTNAEVKAWYKTTGSADIKGYGSAITFNSSYQYDSSSYVWSGHPQLGTVLFTAGATNYGSISIPGITATSYISIETMIRIDSYNASGLGNAPLLKIERTFNTYISFFQYSFHSSGLPNVFITVTNTGEGPTTIVDQSTVLANITTDTWHHLRFYIDNVGYKVYLNGALLGSYDVANALTDRWSGQTIPIDFGGAAGWWSSIIVKAS